MPTLSIRWGNKSALSIRALSWTDTVIMSFPLPPFPKLLVWKFEDFSVNPYLIEKSKHEWRTISIYLQVGNIVNGIDDSCLDVIRGSRLLDWVLCIVETEIGRCPISSTIRIAFIA